MERHEISKLQFEILVKSIDVLPDYIKHAFLKSFSKFIAQKTAEERKFTMRAAYNIFNLLSVIGSKDLFLNGRVIFTVDMGKIFKYIAEDLAEDDKLYLFPGCEISRDITNTYLILTIYSIVPKTGNLKFSSDAISLPVETLTINTKYNNTLITKLKELLI